MAKVFDLIGISLTIFVFSLAWITFLSDNFLMSIIWSTTISIAVLLTVYYVNMRKKKPYSYDRLALELSVKGSEYLVEIFNSILKNAVIESGFNYILLENVLIFACFRFSMIGLNDVGNICSLAVKKDRKNVFVLARGIDRNAVGLLNSYDIKLTVVKIKTIYKFLEKNNALPNLEKQKYRFSAKEIFSFIFAKANLKRYLFSGGMLILLSFVTPLKIYYLISGSILILLAAVTMTPLGKGSFKENKLFDLITNADNENEESEINVATDDENSPRQNANDDKTDDEK